MWNQWASHLVEHTGAEGRKQVFLELSAELSCKLEEIVGLLLRRLYAEIHKRMVRMIYRTVEGYIAIEQRSRAGDSRLRSTEFVLP
jgi:hypothetical protein